MANYRRKLSKNDLKLIHSIYTVHTDDEGGIFTKDKRRKLLGLKPEHGKHFDDTADFWYDVRTSVKSGLKDLELFFEVADTNQIKELFYDSPQKEEMDVLKKTRDYNKQYIIQRQIPSLTRTLSALFQNYYQTKKYKNTEGKIQKYSEHIEEVDSWRAYLVNEMINLSIKYLREHNLISSKAHERLTDEFIDMVNVEIARGIKIPLDERVKGYA